MKRRTKEESKKDAMIQIKKIKFLSACCAGEKSPLSSLRSVMEMSFA